MDPINIFVYKSGLPGYRLHTYTKYPFFAYGGKTLYTVNH